MTSEQVAAIERLRELEKKATPGEWKHNSSDYVFTGEDGEDGDLIADFSCGMDRDKILTCALRNDGMPLIEALQQSLSEAQADARVFSGSYNALAEDFGRLKEENERLRDLLKDACADLGRMTLLRDKFYCEMETAQTETVFAKKEIERLRAGIAKAVYALGNSEPYADKLNEALKDSPDFGLQLLVDGFYQALEALHDA